MHVSVNQPRKSQEAATIEYLARRRTRAGANQHDSLAVDRNITIPPNTLVGDDGPQDYSIEHRSLVSEVHKMGRANRNPSSLGKAMGFAALYPSYEISTRHQHEPSVILLHRPRVQWIELCE